MRSVAKPVVIAGSIFMRTVSKPLALSVLLSVMAVVNPASAAEFYKWVDEDGNTVYSRTPPPGEIKADIVKAQVKADTETAAKALQDDVKRADELRETRNKKAEEQQLAQEEIALREENCRRSRTRLASYSVPQGRIIQA
ncbi:MAG: DUF4124 protein [Gammaproteobacteria bacterium]|nr:DUF4124 protein [Gammaproteobacteria bacterium]